MDAKFENVKVLEVTSGTKKDGQPWFRVIVADMEKASRLTVWTDAASYTVAQGMVGQFVDVTIHDCQQEGFRWRFGERASFRQVRKSA